MPVSNPYVTVDSKGRVTLPEEVRSALGIATGEVLLVERTGRGSVELIPASIVPNDQLWFYHPEMQARIAEAEQQIREGRVTRASTLEEAQAVLDSWKLQSKQSRGGEG